jgi:hypothetical protein
MPTWAGGRPASGQLLDQLQGGADRPGRLPVVDHHPVAQPLHRHPAVLPRGPPDQDAERARQLGGLVAALLGQPGIAHQVQEAHRWHPLWPVEHAGGVQRSLDVLDQLLGPQELLLPAVDAQ